MGTRAMIPSFIVYSIGMMVLGSVFGLILFSPATIAIDPGKSLSILALIVAQFISSLCLIKLSSYYNKGN